MRHCVPDLLPDVKTLAARALFALALALPGAALQAEEPPERGANEVAEVLLAARHAGAGGAELAKRLAAGGESALPQLFELLTRGRFDVLVGERGQSRRQLEPHERTAALTAFGQLPWAKVRHYLDERRAETAEPSDSERLVALGILGAGGGRSDLGALLAWSEPPESQRRVARGVGNAFGSALSSILERQPSAADGVPGLYRSAHLTLLPEVWRALGAQPTAKHLDVLTTLLGLVPEADPLLLAEIGHVAGAVRYPADEPARGRVRGYLAPLAGDAPQQLLIEAVVAAGKLEDSASVPVLIELLEHPSSNVRRLASSALTDITSLHLGLAPGEWTTWYEKSKSWWASKAEQDLARVRTADVPLASQAILQLSKQRPFRHELAGPLSEGLSRSEEELVLLTCAALGHLGSTLAVEPLLARLDDPSLEVRRAAYLALRRLTGEEHGEHSRTWHDAGW